ncbi:MAG TPA: hypothetical protein VH092_22155 [Urbifossiella sp.]|jgi:Holliday junction resolvase-like predicted endonuclease|nr:hypothetical protein [Urbifossiella sp.]
MPPDGPTDLVLIASEQLWPNLHAVEHWAAGLRRVYVYHTADDRSAGPARKLAAFCKAQYELEVTLAAGDDSPDAVARQLRAWIATAPNGSWLVNATGGTKLMFDGAASVRNHPGVRVVYRELKNRWYELGWADGTPGWAGGTPTAAPLDIPADATDRIPVVDLVRTLWETDALVVSAGPKPAPLDVPAVAAALVATAGRWADAFRAAGADFDDKETGGKLFERYVAAGLLAMGVTNLARSVVQRGATDGEGSNPTQEIDLVANHGARLLVFDCKLRTAEEDKRGAEGITSQIRQAAQTAPRLGGLAARVVLLRPNRQLGETDRALAEDLKVEVIDRTAHGTFFRRLAKFVGAGLPESLARADAVFADPETVAQTFHTSALMARVAAAADGPVDLTRLCRDWSRERGLDWAVGHVCGNFFYLQYANRAGRPRDVLEDAVRAWLGGFGTIRCLAESRSGDTLYALAEVADKRRWTAALRARRARPLLDTLGP